MTCIHDEPNVGFDPVRLEMICRCGARKDVHELNQPWRTVTPEADVRLQSTDPVPHTTDIA